jgi:predicted Zn-dependent protease
VSQPVEISDRDLQTLKRVYAQPTRLGGNVGMP